ncbi:unnamed protein product [Rhizophagus irregularis]|nr:unnamed protein product [Rhizophagus irregularis]
MMDNLTQIEHTSSNGLDNQTKFYPTVNLSSYNRIVHKRRNKRKLRRGIKYPLNYIRVIRRLPIQITNDPFANPFFNGSPF